MYITILYFLNVYIWYHTYPFAISQLLFLISYLDTGKIIHFFLLLSFFPFFEPTLIYVFIVLLMAFIDWPGFVDGISSVCHWSIYVCVFSAGHTFKSEIVGS